MSLPTIVSIGDGIIDAVELLPGLVQRFPGGAALNLAVGVARLGLVSRLVTRFGLDQDGFLLERYLPQEGVRILNPPNVDFTGVVLSTRKNGEPTYHFRPEMFRRRIFFTADVLGAIKAADAVAVNSFPFDNSAQVDALVAAFRAASGLVVVDPNPRPNLIPDMAAYRAGAERAMAAARLVKISDEDMALFYGETPKEVAARLFALGVEHVLMTHGSGGARVMSRDGMHVVVPISTGEGPVVDTMGAGDATLATVVARIVRGGMPANDDGWRECLTEAMRVAAATCASPGGALALPRSTEARSSPVTK